MKKLISSIFGFIVSISLVVLAAVFVAAGNRTGEENFANATRTQSITINFYNEYKNKPDQLELLTTKTYEPEEEITYPETAALPHKNSRTQNENYEWKFVGWQRMNGFELEDVELNELEEDTDVYAKYEQEMIGFTINFFNEQVTYGETALASFKYKFDSTEREYTGPEPTKESTLAYRYTFDHWETRDHKTINSLDDITKENISTYTNDDRINLFATYTQTAIEYAIQYNLGEEGTLTDEKTSYTYEDEPFDLPTPTTKTEEVTFVGWTGTDITSPSPQKEVRIDPKQYGALKNREYTAIYSTQKYKITFVIYEADTKNPGSVDHPTIDVTYGTAIPDNLTTATISFGDITVTATPSTENVRYSFEFECFETSETQVTHDMEILVRFKLRKRWRGNALPIR